MDVLNFISWIKNGQQVTTVDPTQTLIPLGLRDPRRDDGYRSGAITAQDFINQIPVPPSLFETSCNNPLATVRTGYNSTSTCGVNLAFNSQLGSYNGFIGGGGYNSIYNCNSVIGGGLFNVTYGAISFVGGGLENRLTNSSNCSVLVGGSNNCIMNCASFVGSGERNVISGCFGIVNGGCCNSINSCFSGIVGGRCNVANCTEAFVVGTCITTNRTCATFVNNLSIMNVPTSSAGLPSKAVWSNAGILTIVP